MIREPEPTTAHVLSTPPRGRVVQALHRRLDEAVRVVEARRYRRILSAGRLPAIYSFAVLILAWILAPFLFNTGGLLAGVRPLDVNHGWAAGVMLTVTGVAAGLGGYFRTLQLWHGERQRRSYQSWLLTRQDPRCTAVTTVAMAAVLGVLLTAAPLLLALVTGLVSGVPPAGLALGVVLVASAALFGAALGAAVFFISWNLVPRALFYLGSSALGLFVMGLWLRLEAVQHGWLRPWEEHPARVAAALLLATPAPYAFGACNPGWWRHAFAEPLGSALPAWIAGGLYVLLLLTAAAYLTYAAVRGYVALAEDPDRMEEKPRGVSEELGEEFYWKGFGNPVLTRDIRTRLRSRDTAEFIFFASIAVAAGAFVPLLVTARDLSDPLLTASAARQVFFWLTMTLVALVTLVTPGLTADVLTQERALGTLELLIATPLRPREILIGKLTGAVCVVLLLITPSLPLFGLCYLFHGASVEQVGQVYLLLVTTLAVSGLIGLTQSAIHARAGMAKFWTYAVSALFVGFPGGPFWIAAAAAAPSAQMRQSLSGGVGIGMSVVVGVIWTFVLFLFWGNASEQLEYAEH